MKFPVQFFNLEALFKQFEIKLSRGEICVANFIPPANGASLGSYFFVKNLTLAIKHCLNQV